jgi:error-prone DNA polymerase
VDPARIFERFISRERGEPPDIEVDFEHQRREEVIQYLYQKYGRERAASLITYRPKSAVRDVGKALGLDLDQVDRLARSLTWWTARRWPRNGCGRRGSTRITLWCGVRSGWCTSCWAFRGITTSMWGGVISRGPLCRLVPIENTAMAERTVIEWDKDDLETLGHRAKLRYPRFSVATRSCPRF